MRNSREVERKSGCGRIAARSGRLSRITLVTRARKRLALAVPLALALTGCATVHTKYIQTYCVSQDQYAKLKQAEPGKIGSQLDGNAQHDLKLIAGNDLELRTFSDGLLGVIGSCVDPNTEAPAK